MAKKMHLRDGAARVVFRAFMLLSIKIVCARAEAAKVPRCADAPTLRRVQTAATTFSTQLLAAHSFAARSPLVCRSFAARSPLVRRSFVARLPLVCRSFAARLSLICRSIVGSRTKRRVNVEACAIISDRQLRHGLLTIANCPLNTRNALEVV